MKWQKRLSIILGTLAVLCICLLLYIKIFDIKIFNLQSASMKPAIQEGNLILNRMEPFDEIEVKDIITYKHEDIYITHRVKEVNRENQTILCKGDANEVDDQLFIDYKTQYYGTLMLNIPLLGNVFSFLHGGWGIFISVLIILVLIGSIAYDLYITKIRED